MSKKILIVAGDHSADTYCAGIAEVLLRDNRDIEIYALGGRKLEAAGVKLLYNLVDNTVMGFYEVFKNWFRFRRIFRDKVRTCLVNEKPDLVFLADFYGFNIHVASLAGKLGIPVIYYISPKIWAWNYGRIRKIKKLVSKMLVIFPFEEELYRKEGVDVSFVGNPLLDIIQPEGGREDIYNEFGLKKDLPVVGLMPGSRFQEVDHILPVMLKSAERLSRGRKVQFALVLADTISRSYIEEKYDLSAIDCRVSGDEKYNLRSIMTLCVTASGTATLENAYLGVPMIVVYKTSFFTYHIARKLVKINMISLANIIAGRKVVPELVQSEATEENISAIAAKWLADANALSKVREGLLTVREKMGAPGAHERVAGVIREFINAQEK